MTGFDNCLAYPFLIVSDLKKNVSMYVSIFCQYVIYVIWYYE